VERDARPLRRSEDAKNGFALPQIQHRELRYFVAVAEELHFTRAAERLEMSQPPLSAAIAQLESKLGTRLFERDSRNVRMTPSGAALLQRARGILRQLDDAVEATRQAPGAPATARLVADSVSAWAIVPALRLALERNGDTVALDVEQLVPGAIPNAVRAGDADLAVFVCADCHPGLEMDLLRRVPPVVLFERSHPLAGRKRVRLEELAEYRLALWPEAEAPDAHELVLGIFAGVKLKQPIAVLPMFSGAWAEELEAGAFCVVSGDAAMTAEYATARIADTSSTFDTWLAWSEATPPASLQTVRAAASALREARGWAAEPS
jgi:DNA-binding transcriptional LysR family regulator